MQKLLLSLVTVSVIMSSCSKKIDIIPTPEPAEGPVIDIVIPDGGFTADNLKWLTIKAAVTGDSATTAFTWTIGQDTIARTRDLVYVFKTAGTYTLTLTAGNQQASSKKDVQVKVTGKTYQDNFFKILEYFPAPGQFVNKMPAYEEGDNDAAMAAKAQAELKLDAGGMISLGGFGGFVTMAFDHVITDSFIVYGNAFANWSEPGIIMVAADVNGNGLADDEWYEIAGSDYSSPGTIHNYRITYYKPDENKEPTPDEMYLADTTYILWKDNQGQSGYIAKNVFSDQPYYPRWKGDSISFTGTKLNSKIADTNGDGTYFESYPFSWGYADNLPNDDPNTVIQVKWAVDSKGTPVHLRGIDFIKVYTGINGQAGWLGEISTEVTGAKDLGLK
jgi:PKD repeat protein